MITKLNYNLKLKIILIFLQIVGVNLMYANHNRNSKINPYLLAWNKILIIFTITLIIVVYTKRKHIFFGEFAVGQFTDIIQFLGPALSMLVLLIELNYKCGAHVKIQNNLNRIFEMISIDLFNGIVNRLFAKWIVLFVITLMVEINIMVNIVPEKTWSLHWYTTIVPVVMIRLGLLYYVIYVDLITGALRTINGILVKNQSHTRVLDVTQEIKKVRQLANILWNTVRLLNSTYGWFQLIYINQLLFTLTCDLYWVVGSVVVKPHPYFVSSALCNVSPMVAVVTLFSATENLKREGIQLIPNLMKLNKSKYSDKLKTFIIRFAYQITLSGYYCEVYGFFRLDYICLRNLIAAICTYISIFRSLSPN